MKSSDCIDDHRKLKGWDGFIWHCVGNRKYHQNTNQTGHLFAQTLAILLVIGSILFFKYFPFKFIGLLLILAMTVVAVHWPIKYANESPYLVWVNVIIGAVGLLSHQHFGLTVFHFHLEQYLFWIYLIGGLLAIYRRFWNYVIWKKLDNMVLHKI